MGISWSLLNFFSALNRGALGVLFNKASGSGGPENPVLDIVRLEVFGV
jgi:hypothetical protein